jgi:hypothetical protein
MANKRRICYAVAMDEGRKRVIGIVAAILASLHMQTADDLFGGPQGSPRSDKLIAASVQWAENLQTIWQNSVLNSGPMSRKPLPWKSICIRPVWELGWGSDRINH